MSKDSLEGQAGLELFTPRAVPPAPTQALLHSLIFPGGGSYTPLIPLFFNLTDS